MSRRTEFKGSSAARRRDRRAGLQSEAAMSSEELHRPTPSRVQLQCNRKPKSRVESAMNPIDLTVLAEYHEQIESNLARIERKNHKVWYREPGERGITCAGRQKMKGKSIPLI